MKATRGLKSSIGEYLVAENVYGEEEQSSHTEAVGELDTKAAGTGKDSKATLAGFVCRRCGACCRIKNGIVRVSDAEIARIAAFLGVAEQDFIDNDTELAPDRQGLILKSRPDGACAWLADDNRCRIHPVKPEKCRTFPYEWTNDDSAEVCPGIAAQPF